MEVIVGMLLVYLVGVAPVDAAENFEGEVATTVSEFCKESEIHRQHQPRKSECGPSRFDVHNAVGEGES